MVLALTLFWMEEARSRLQDAQSWFAEHPKHPKNVELLLVQLLFEQRELLEQSSDPNFETRFGGITNNRLGLIRDRVQKLADGFTDAQDVQRFVMHHPLK